MLFRTEITVIRLIRKYGNRKRIKRIITIQDDLGYIVHVTLYLLGETSDLTTESSRPRVCLPRKLWKCG